jgi:hypothetical protein
MATGFLADAIDLCSDALTAAGIPWAYDPGQARPKCVMIELPEFTLYSKAVADIRIRLRVCGAPPGNKANNDFILTTVEDIMTSTVIVESGSPGTADYGNQQLPTYDLVARIGTNNR